MEETAKIILGIDPGTQILGFGVIRIIGNKASYIDMGVVNLKKEKDHFVTLKKISAEVTGLIEKHMPDELAIEAPFYGKNPQVMLKLGRAQGAAIAAALVKDIPIFEYAPRSVKLAVTGKGAASKEQVAMLVQRLLKIDCPQKYPDATDALAIALCHFYHQGSVALFAGHESRNKTQSHGKKENWETFIKNNPDKVKK